MITWGFQNGMTETKSLHLTVISIVEIMTTVNTVKGSVLEANRSMSRKDQIRCCFPYIINKSGVLLNRDRDRERRGELAIGNCSPHFIFILKSINGHKAH